MTAAEDFDQQRAALRLINPAPYNAEAPPQALAGEITPTELHYVRSNFPVPVHDGVLHVGGAVENPVSLTLDDLRARAKWSGRSRSSARGTDGWRCGRCRPANPGAAARSPPLAGVAPCCTRSCSRCTRQQLPSTSASKVPITAPTTSVRFSRRPSKDEMTFVRALPLALAADPAAEILIAYEMNGEPLSPDHGAPFRIVVPRWYAVASVKWLTRIDVMTEPYTGEFQTGHYVYEWPDRPHEFVTPCGCGLASPIPPPRRSSTPGTYTVRGKAWSGTGPVTRVDVSLTGAGDWLEAQLEAARGPYQWQDWSFDWDATDVGRHSLRARAIDAAGNVQPEVPPWNRLGYGNNAVEVIYVDVR